MKLYYENGYKNALEYVKDCKDLNEAMQFVSDYWNPVCKRALGYKIPYIRINEMPEYYWMDFGSYSNFYRLYKEGFEPEK